MEFRTPEDFIRYYSDKLKEEFGTLDLQVNKAGFLGFLLNVLGFTAYDAKQYYDHLFKEAFLVTARNDENLHLHASTYGYIAPLSSPARAAGSVKVDLSLFPPRPAGSFKREVVLDGLSDIPIEFDVEGYRFSMPARYHFVEEQDAWYAVVYTEQGEALHIPAANREIAAPLVDCRQYYQEVVSFFLPAYQYGSFYPYLLELEPGDQLAELQVLVRERDSLQAEPFEVSYVKYYGTFGEKKVFLKRLSSFSWLLEFGSGIHGLWVPEAEVTLVIRKTAGEKGNISRTSEALVSQPSQITLVDYFRQGNAVVPVSTVYSSSQYLKVFFDHASEGKDQPTGDSLRSLILKYVQSRDNLVSQRDFYNVTDKYLKDFRFLFRKTAVWDNLFYLLRVLRDRFQVVVPATNHSVPLLPSLDPPEGVAAQPGDGNGALPAGEYSYVVTALDGFGETSPSFPVSVTVDGVTQRSATVSWNPVENAVSYRVYGRGLAPDQYWEVKGTSFTDTGEDGRRGQPRPGYEFSFMPVFEINGEEFISPFLYRYNPFMDWFEGFLVYDLVRGVFRSVDLLDASDPSYSPPPLVINLVWEGDRTLIVVKSYQMFVQELSPPVPPYDVRIKLTSPELNIHQEEMQYISDSGSPHFGAFVYEYTENGGYLWKPFTLDLQLEKYSGSAFVPKVRYVSEELVQVHDISDQLVLATYIYRGTGQKYVVNIPCLRKSAFDADRVYYLDRLRQFLLDLRFKENRMVSDEVQFRFLNSHMVEAYYLKRTVFQEYDFDLVFPLKISVEVLVSMRYVEANAIDLGEEREKMLLELASAFQSRFTGAEIVFYPSMVVDLIHNHPYVKSVSVTVTDAVGQVIDRGLEVNPEDKIFEKLSPSSSDSPEEAHLKKFKALRYTPSYFWWDVDAIGLRFLASYD